MGHNSRVVVFMYDNVHVTHPFRDHVVVIEKQLEACESELIQTTSKMTHLEQKCAHLEAELHSQTK